MNFLALVCKSGTYHTEISKIKLGSVRKYIDKFHCAKVGRAQLLVTPRLLFSFFRAIIRPSPAPPPSMPRRPIKSNPPPPPPPPPPAAAVPPLPIQSIKNQSHLATIWWGWTTSNDAVWGGRRFNYCLVGRYRTNFVTRPPSADAIHITYKNDNLRRANHHNLYLF